jgi:biotin operon repressor
MNAVKTARQGGSSWAEVATMLGISRQAAWERWRDLDGT